MEKTSVIRPDLTSPGAYILFLGESLISVSYTHLDVYKRQVIVPGGHGAAAAGQADDHPLAAGGAHRGGAQALDEFAGGLVAVSYTHLGQCRDASGPPRRTGSPRSDTAGR